MRRTVPWLAWILLPGCVSAAAVPDSRPAEDVAMVVPAGRGFPGAAPLPSSARPPEARLPLPASDPAGVPLFASVPPFAPDPAFAPVPAAARDDLPSISPEGGGRARSGIYVGAGAFAAAGSLSVNESDAESGSGAGATVFAGWRFSPKFGVELFADRRSYTFDDTSGPFSVDVDLESTIFGVQAKGYFLEIQDLVPVERQLQPYFLLGLGWGTLDVEAPVFVSGSLAGSVDESQPAYAVKMGLGFDLEMTRHVAVFAELDLVFQGSADFSLASADLVGGVLLRF